MFLSGGQVLALLFNIKGLRHDLQGGRRRLSEWRRCRLGNAHRSCEMLSLGARYFFVTLVFPILIKDK